MIDEMRSLLLLLSLLLVGCQGAQADESDALIRAELAAYGTEAAALRADMQVQRTEVVLTVDVAATEAANYAQYNALLAGTVQAALPPTPTPLPVNIDTQGPLPFDSYNLEDGVMRFVQVGLASQITPEDRCFVRHQAFFQAMNTNVIYMTGVALNLRAGTELRVDWQFGGEVVYSNNWVAPGAMDATCFALELRPSNAPFTPGNWQATLFVNGAAEEPSSFTIVGG